MKQTTTVLTEDELEEINDKVWRRLLECITDKVLDMFKSKVPFEAGIQAWQFLQKKFTQKDINSQLSLFLQICRTKQAQNESVDTFSTSLTNMFSELENIGMNLHEKTRLGITILNLQKKYDNQVDNLIHNEELTEEILVTKLSTNEKRHKLRDSNEQTATGGTSFYGHGKQKPVKNPKFENGKHGKTGKDKVKKPFCYTCRTLGLKQSKHSTSESKYTLALKKQVAAESKKPKEKFSFVTGKV